MRNSRNVDFLRPDIRKLTLFGILSFICIGGVIQTYVFIGEESGIPKPPLYDTLRPFDLWLPWIIFALPVHLIGRLLNFWWLIEYFPNIGFRLPLASIIYAYTISCWTIHVWDRWLTYRGRRRVISIGIASVLLLYLPIVFQPLTILSYFTKIVSGFIFLSLILIVYIVSIYGLYRLVRAYMKF
mgnify:CR=1 FL=1